MESDLFHRTLTGAVPGHGCGLLFIVLRGTNQSHVRASNVNQRLARARLQYWLQRAWNRESFIGDETVCHLFLHLWASYHKLAVFVSIFSPEKWLWCRFLVSLVDAGPLNSKLMCLLLSWIHNPPKFIYTKPPTSNTKPIKKMNNITFCITKYIFALKRHNWGWDTIWYCLDFHILILAHYVHSCPLPIHPM